MLAKRRRRGYLATEAAPRGTVQDAAFASFSRPVGASSHIQVESLEG
jgi:hypothetical protein